MRPLILALMLAGTAIPFTSSSPAAAKCRPEAGPKCCDVKPCNEPKPPKLDPCLRVDGCKPKPSCTKIWCEERRPPIEPREARRG